MPCARRSRALRPRSWVCSSLRVLTTGTSGVAGSARPDGAGTQREGPPESARAALPPAAHAPPTHSRPAARSEPVRGTMRLMLSTATECPMLHQPEALVHVPHHVGDGGAAAALRVPGSTGFRGSGAARRARARGPALSRQEEWTWSLLREWSASARQIRVSPRVCGVSGSLGPLGAPVAPNREPDVRSPPYILFGYHRTVPFTPGLGKGYGLRPRPIGWRRLGWL